MGLLFRIMPQKDNPKESGDYPKNDNSGNIRKDYEDLHERVDNAQGGQGRASKQELDSIMQAANQLLPDVSRSQGK